MDHFNYQNNELFAEAVAVRDIVNQYGSPCYIYSRATLERHWLAFDQAFGDTLLVGCNDHPATRARQPCKSVNAPIDQVQVG